MTSNSPTRRRVLVIGGGIFGTSTAAQLARRGADVTLVTAAALTSGASGRSLAWLNSAAIRNGDYHKLRMIGIDRYRTFAARTPSAEFLRFNGGLTWAADGESFADLYAHERSVGYDAVWLNPNEIAAVTPGVDPTAVAAEGAIFNPGEGWANLPSIVAVLADELAQRGGRLITGATAQVDAVDGVAIGATLSSGERLLADAVLVATGPDVPAQLAALGVPLPDQTPAAFLAFIKPVDTALTAVLNTPRVSMRPTPNGGIALDSEWGVGELVAHPDGSLHLEDSAIEELLAEGSRVLAGNPKLELDWIGAGLKPIPGDGEPALGAIPQVPGLFVAFSHSGATLGLIAGELLADEILTGTRSPLLASFRPERFTGVPAL